MDSTGEICCLETVRKKGKLPWLGLPVSLEPLHLAKTFLALTSIVICLVRSSLISSDLGSWECVEGFLASMSLSKKIGIL